MDRIQIQASKLWDLLFSEETATTYQSTLNLTGTILKESAQLIWLIICSVFVFGAWFSDTSVKTGNRLRTWIDEQSNPSASTAEKKDLAATGKSLLESGRTSAAYLLAQAREQLGLEPEPEPVKKKTELKPTASVQPSAAAATPSPTPIAKPTPSAPATKPAVTESPAPSSFSTSAAPGTAASATADEEEDDDGISRESTDDGWPPQTDD